MGSMRIFVVQNVSFVTAIYDACHWQTRVPRLKLMS